MRLGQLLALQPGDLDFKGGFIEVRVDFAKGSITTTKSGKIRRLDMSTDLASTLKAHLTASKKEALSKGWGASPEWLFYNLLSYISAFRNPEKLIISGAPGKIRTPDLRIRSL